LAEFQLPMEERLISIPATSRDDPSLIEIKTLMSLSDPPDAILTDRELVVLSLLRELGYRVPIDISLVGLDESETAGRRQAVGFPSPRRPTRPSATPTPDSAPESCSIRTAPAWVTRTPLASTKASTLLPDSIRFGEPLALRRPRRTTTGEPEARSPSRAFRSRSRPTGRSSSSAKSRLPANIPTFPI